MPYQYLYKVFVKMVTNNPKAPGGVDTWILYLVGQINPTSSGSGPTILGGVEGGLRNLEKVRLLNPTTPGGYSHMFYEYSSIK